MRTSPRTGRQRRRGAALVIALVILAVLAMLGAPFAASMLLRRKQSTRTSAVATLRDAARDLRNRAAAHLFETHEDTEGRRFDAESPPGRRPNPTPVATARRAERRAEEGGDRVAETRPQDVDGKEELAPELVLRQEYENGLRTLARAEVADEQGKVDLATASFLLLGNVLGSSHLAEPVEDDARRLVLAEENAFPDDGDTATRDGLLVIYDALNGTFEAVTYRSCVGDELRGVDRGELLSVARAHDRGALVFDARALKIFAHQFYAPGRATFAAVAGLRAVNEWPLARFFVDELWHHHLSMSDLPRSKLTF